MTEVGGPLAITSRSVFLDHCLTWVSQDEYGGVPDADFEMLAQKLRVRRGYVRREVVGNEMELLGRGVMSRDIG